ncbi:MAG: hypothetical protein QM808_16135 [Steroidobacteraceae bacterium]
MQFAHRSLFCSVISLACIHVAAAQSNQVDDNNHVSAMRYVALDVQADDNNSQQYSGTGSFTLGNYTWLHGTLGKIVNNDATSNLGDLKFFGAGAGVRGEHWQVQAGFSRYRNDDNFRQRDINGSVDWLDERFSIGIDVANRRTDNSFDTTVTRTLTSGTVTVPIHAVEKLTGHGFGAHASINLTDALILSLGGIDYSYDNSSSVEGSYTYTSTASPTILQQLLDPIRSVIRDRIEQRIEYLAGSQMTRSIALLDNSYNAGLTYQFDSAAVGGQYIRDKALETGEITDTFILDSSLFLGDHWILSPMVGHSRNDQTGTVTFGGLTVSYNW